MKKLLLIVLLTLLLSSCGLREKLLTAPDEMQIPSGSKVAICVVDDIEYKHIYKQDGIYQYFIDNILQDDESLNNIQEQAYLNGESVYNYLVATYGVSGCTITDYVDTEKD